MKKIYNLVNNDKCNIFPLGALLTDKQLEKIHKTELRRDWPTTIRIKADTRDTYWCFGVRFAKKYEIVISNMQP